tara:strand:- start:16966 stop:17556 length:591 start_codon:yes stop_codon:yes gene_type:complete
MLNVIQRGRVLDNQGAPLMGAHIITTNSNPKRATITNENGNFTIDGSVGETFQVTYIGFESQPFTMKAINPDRNFRLVESAFQLDEVTLKPRNTIPVKTKNPFNIGGLLEGIGNIFSGAAQQIATPPLNPANGITVTGQQGNVYVPDTPINTGGINGWINQNPLIATGLVLGTIAFGAYVVKKSDSKKAVSKTTKK